MLNCPKLVCGEHLEVFVILSAISLPVKSPVAQAALFESVLSASIADCVA